MADLCDNADTIKCGAAEKACRAAEAVLMHHLQTSRETGPAYVSWRCDGSLAKVLTGSQCDGDRLLFHRAHRRSSSQAPRQSSAMLTQFKKNASNIGSEFTECHKTHGGI